MPTRGRLVSERHRSGSRQGWTGDGKDLVGVDAASQRCRRQFGCMRGILLFPGTRTRDPPAVARDLSAPRPNYTPQTHALLLIRLQLQPGPAPASSTNNAGWARLAPATNSYINRQLDAGPPRTSSPPASQSSFRNPNLRSSPCQRPGLLRLAPAHPAAPSRCSPPQTTPCARAPRPRPPFTRPSCPRPGPAPAPAPAPPAPGWRPKSPPRRSPGR
jgi:hypothetical protein